MRVLVANIPLPQNRFLVDLNEALSRQCALVHSSDVFWNMEGEFDIVHLHFPEYVTYGVQSAYANGLTEELMADVDERLRYWSQRSSIVITRHVLLPHSARNDPKWARMYELFYSYADGVVHFAGSSREEFEERYGGTRFTRERQPLHEVIPHQNYASLPNDMTRAESRRRLRIPPAAPVLLVFGGIRGDAERNLVLNTFAALDAPGKILLVPRWPEKLHMVAWIRFKYWLRDIQRLYYRLHPRFRFGYEFVPETDAQLYLNAADVLLIPRLRVLNSGNIALGMTFGRIVVGPDSWNVGEILRRFGNPVFDPEHPETAVNAVTEGFRLAAEGIVARRNREVALTEWDADRIAKAYVSFFERLAAGRTMPPMLKSR